MAEVRVNGLLRLLFRAPICLYRLGLGNLLGHRFLLLIHVGRRSGLPRHTVLEIIEYRAVGPELVAMSGFGPEADWSRNIEATHRSGIVVGSRHFEVVHRLLETAEVVSVFASYERRHWVIAPIIRLLLSWLLGWRYDGTEADRIRLSGQLPFVAFRPRE